MKLDKTKYISSQGQGTWLWFWSCKSRNCTKFIWVIFLSQPCLVSAGLGFGPEVEYFREESLESPESLESLVGKEKTAKTFVDEYFVARAFAFAIAQWLWWGGSRWRRGSCSIVSLALISCAVSLASVIWNLGLPVRGNPLVEICPSLVSLYKAWSITCNSPDLTDSLDIKESDRHHYLSWNLTEGSLVSTSSLIVMTETGLRHFWSRSLPAIIYCLPGSSIRIVVIVPFIPFM